MKYYKNAVQMCILCILCVAVSVSVKWSGGIIWSPFAIMAVIAGAISIANCVADSVSFSKVLATQKYDKIKGEKNDREKSYIRISPQRV